MPEAFSDSLSMFHIVIFLARSRCTRARGRPQINRPYLPDGCVNSNLVHKFPQHVFLLLISVQRLQAARAVQRSQALQLIRAVCCIWCDAVCCCPGIRGIFTALLALVRWARPPRSVYAAKWALALIVLRLLKCYDKHILVFFVVLASLLHCSLHAYTPHPIRQASTLSLLYPPLQKKKSVEWMDRPRDPDREQRNFEKSVLVRWKPKTGRKWKN